MQIVDRFKSQAEFLQFRDHLGKVMAEKMSIPLKQRKLDELVSQVVGAKDFNTALAMVGNERDYSERLDAPDFEIRAVVKADEGSRLTHAIFDANEYFGDAWSNGTLTLVLRDLLRHRFNVSYAGDMIARHTEMARHAYKDHKGVEMVLDYCAENSLGCSLVLDESHLIDWLNNQRLYVLALWVEASLERLSIAEFCEKNPEQTSYLQSTKRAEVPGFGESSDFKFVRVGKNWAWQYSHMIMVHFSKKSFQTKQLAFADFLDYFMATSSLTY